MSEKIKKCPKCGKEFTCSHDENCWCTRYEISPENGQIMRQQFDDCLCEDCMKEYGRLKEEK